MLTGRESLIRLIGKRRKFLPNRQSILSTTIQSSLNLCIDANGGSASAVGTEGSSEQNHKDVVENKMAPPDWVTCPVCGNNVRAEDYMINSHLDACLVRGTKRKLCQRTLLQLNFCSRSKVEIHSTESDYIRANVVQTIPDKHSASDTMKNLSDLGAEKDDNILCKSPFDPASIIPTYRVGLAEKPVSDDIINYRVPSLLCENEMPKNDMAECVDDISGVFLATFIVGRSFADDVELNPGASITLFRDPNNPKDPNAIKVLATDECNKVLGFLPRELALYLSPLMDKFSLNFEGHIASCPEHALAVVPVQIVCQNKISFGEKECADLQVFNSLWKHALRVVEVAKTYPPSMTKYQKNFLLLIQEVLRTNHHLLTDDEKMSLETFISLSDDSQRLFVRLYTRKGPWFRMSNISYAEIFDCQQAVKGLTDTSYVCSTQSMGELHKDDLEEVLNVLSVGELREILCMIDKKCNRGSRKQEFIAALLSSYRDGLCPFLPSVVLEKTGVCIRISSTAESLIWRTERLFFLNAEQDLSAFLLADLGIIKYPIYNCIISDQIFSGRSDLISYEEAIEVAQIMDQSLDADNSELALRCIEISDSRISNSSMKAIESSSSNSLNSFFTHFSALWVYSKVVLLGVSFLEHERRYNDAINLLKRLLINFTSDGRRGYWTLRLSIDLEHVGHLNESLTVAEEGLLDPWVRAGSRISLQRRVLRLGKPPRRWTTPIYSESVKRKITEVHVQGRPLNCRAGIKSRFYGEDGEQCGVEQLALQYYAGKGGGWQGVHTESGIWLTVFGLLMWDIIFSDVPNVFRTRFQIAPLDMQTDSFYEIRKSIIEPLLQKIQDGMAEEILITSWESHSGTACRGVNWEKHSLSELRAVVNCIGGPCLASICRHLAQDYWSWSSGMPDLLLWRFHGDYSGEAKLVEVKGPRDQLSEQQRAWLLFLMDSGFNVEVCRVSPTLVSM